MVEANWSGYLGFGYVPRRAIGGERSIERIPEVPEERKPNGSGHGSTRVAPAEPTSVDAAALTGELDRTRAELKAARAELEASRKRTHAAGRTANRMRELRSRLTAASQETTTLRGELEGAKRTEAMLAASEQSEMHLQRYSDRLEQRLAAAKAENARLRRR